MSGEGALQTRLLLSGSAPEGRALVVGAPPGDGALLRAAFDAHLFCFEESAQSDETGVTVTGTFEEVVVYLPKGKRRRDYTLAMAAAALRDDGRMVLVGHKNEGIKSARKALLTHFGRIDEIRHGSHCQLFVALEPRRDAFEVASYAVRWPTGLGFDAISYPGTFAEGRLDAASSMLLDVVALPSSGRLLDLGCGSGVLGVEAARREPGLSVVLADHDHLAVRAAAETAALAGIEATAVTSSIYANVQRPFDVILCNPPFHQGVQTDSAAAEAMIAEAPKMLSAGATLWVVANRFLPYEDGLAAGFDQVERVAEDGRFKVIRATGPR